MSLSVKQTTKLVQGCTANDRAAQEGLYKLFYADTLRLCMRYLKTDDLAKEALNTGFLKVFQNISSFEIQKGELGAWIRTIMVRTCIDLGRKELRFNTGINDDEISDLMHVSPTVLDKLYAEDLLSMIRKLPGSLQMVFNLYVVDGYSHKEISESLNITESTSRWHLSEAKKQLRGLLETTNLSNDRPTEPKKSAK